MGLKIHSPELIQKRPDAILFDLDNTLYPYEPAHIGAMAVTTKKGCNLLGVAPQLFEKAFHDARDQIKEQLGKTASSHSRLLYFQRTIELLGIKTQPLLALDLEQTYWRSFLSHAELFHNVVDFLDDLRVLGIPTALVTDLTTQTQFRKLIYFGIEKYFDFVVSSEEAGADKPNPVMFQLALDKLKINDKHKIWMIGDHPHADIEGAKKTIQAVAFQKKHKGVNIAEGENRADVLFEDFSQLRQILSDAK